MTIAEYSQEDWPPLLKLLQNSLKDKSFIEICSCAQGDDALRIASILGKVSLVLSF